MCEEIGTCFRDEFTHLRRLAFALLDVNGDDQICDYDVIEFDQQYIQKNGILPQCSTDVEVLVQTLNAIAKQKG